MFAILILIPTLTTLVGLLLYRQVGKRDFFRLDIVQFLYTFVFSPLLFVWLKSFLLFLAKSELNTSISQTQLFWLDTAFSLVFMYFFAFVAIHSLTKTFEVKLQRDPLFDILAYAEDFHLWISHTSMYFLLQIMVVGLAVTNLFIPLDLPLGRIELYLVMLFGIFTGLVAFAATWLSNFTATKFMRLIKLSFGISFLILVLAYFAFEPTLSGSFAMYWYMIMLFSALVLTSQIVKYSDRSKRFIGRFHHKKGWSDKNFMLIIDKLRPTKETLEPLVPEGEK